MKARKDATWTGRLKHRPAPGRPHPRTPGEKRPGQHRENGAPLGDPDRFERIDEANKDGWGSSR